MTSSERKNSLGGTYLVEILVDLSTSTKRHVRSTTTIASTKEAYLFSSLQRLQFTTYTSRSVASIP
jgi:hypothetical protein